MEPALTLAGLQKSFRGRPVLHHIDLAVARGSLTGLVGLNGAGKTTTLRIALGLLRADGGSARVLGVDSRDVASVGGKVGAVLHGGALDPRLTPEETLHHHALLHGRKGGDAAGALRRVDLEHVRGRKVARLSAGERQRLALARALALRPALLVLDEPLTHLDPGSARHVVDLLRDEVEQQGAAVLLSSHQLEHLERSADRLVLLHRGRVLRDGAFHELLRESSSSWWIEARPRDAALEVLRRQPSVRAAEAVAGDRIEVDVDAGNGSAADLNRALVAAGVEVGLLMPARRTLDDLFAEMIRDADEAALAGAAR